MIADREINCVFLADMLMVRHSKLFSELLQTLNAHYIEVRLLDNVRDIWTRDFCPIQVSSERLVKFRYDPDYLKNDPERKTDDGVVKSFRDIGRCHRSEITLDGGNIVGSRTKAILTDKIYKENPTWKRSDLRAKIQRLLQVDHLIVVPKEPFDHFGHTDAMVRFIDEQSILVNDYSEVDPPFGERLYKVLRRHKLEIVFLPYFAEKRITVGVASAVGCFTNFLHTEKVLVAPVYGTKEDHVALKKLGAVFPGLPIVPLNCTDLAREGGVLNCISATYRIAPKSI